MFLLIVVFLVIIGGAVFVYVKDFSYEKNVEMGVTFTKTYADYLNLDWQEAYLAVLDDLKVKNIRLVAQWAEIEPVYKEYNFTNLDWMITEAAKRHVQIILAIGRRTPRWPECHDPDWLGELNDWEIEQEQLNMIRDVVIHFKQFDNIKMWQVENEPFLTVFGKCPVMSVDLVKREIALVKSLDKRPVMITDSGELSSWVKSAKLGDKFGHTLYRTVYDKRVGFLQYYLPPAFYRFKTWYCGLAKENIIISELQAEPWIPEDFTLNDYQILNRSLPVEKIISNINYAKRTGASQIYLWGVEWWYWLKTVKNEPATWETLKNQF